MMGSMAASGHCKESVPPILAGGFPSFETPRPASANDWERQKPELRKKLWRLLGDLPPLCTPKVTIQKKELCDGCTREHLTFQNGAGDTVYGYLLVPAARRDADPPSCTITTMAASMDKARRNSSSTHLPPWETRRW